MNILLNVLSLSILSCFCTSLSVRRVGASQEKEEPETEVESQVKNVINNLAENTSKWKKFPRVKELSAKKEAGVEEVREVMEWKGSLSFLSDNDQIQKLISRINETPIDEIEVLWSDLDLLQDFLRQIDNGETFGKMRGFELLLRLIDVSISTQLPDSFDKIAAMAAINFNAAIQNNPNAIAFALKANGLERLTTSLSVGLGSKNGLVAKRVVSAISSLIRDTPKAQKRFLEQLNGSAILMDTLKKFNTDHSVTQKVLITVTDLITSDHAAPVVAFKDHL